MGLKHDFGLHENELGGVTYIYAVCAAVAMLRIIWCKVLRSEELVQGLDISSAHFSSSWSVRSILTSSLESSFLIKLTSLVIMPDNLLYFL